MRLTKADIDAFVRQQHQLWTAEKRLFGKPLTSPLRLVSKEWLVEAVRVLNRSITHETDEFGCQVNYIDYMGCRFICHGYRQQKRG